MGLAGHRVAMPGGSAHGQQAQQGGLFFVYGRRPPPLVALEGHFVFEQKPRVSWVWTGLFMVGFADFLVLMVASDRVTDLRIF
jgi:hypothetical protein